MTLPATITAIPLPPVPVTVRPATADDLPFIDALQKKHAKMVGWMPRQQLEGKIAAENVLLAETNGDSPRRHGGTEACSDSLNASVSPCLRGENGGRGGWGM